MRQVPNRLIKSSIHESDKVNRMSDFQFRLWVNLITYVDDYGRGDARPAVIKGNCFPLRERLTAKDIEAALNALAGIGCVSLYEVDGKPYLCFPNWESHQSIRNKKSRFPAPDSACTQLQAIESNCMQLQANVPVIQSEYEWRARGAALPPAHGGRGPCLLPGTREQRRPAAVRRPLHGERLEGRREIPDEGLESRCAQLGGQRLPEPRRTEERLSQAQLYRDGFPGDGNRSLSKEGAKQ